MQTIADELGTSKSTVSMALADHPKISAATKAKVREASLRLGYLTEVQFEARRRQEVQRQCRVLLAAVGDISVRALEAELRNYVVAKPGADGVRLEVASFPSNDPVRITEELAPRVGELDGLLLCGRVSTGIVAALLAQEWPVVGLGPLMDVSDLRPLGGMASTVSYEATEAAQEATRELLAKGHRRIALITSRLRHRSFFADWENGYRLALLQAGVAVDERLIDRERVGWGPDETPGILQVDPAPTAFIFSEPTFLYRWLSSSGRHVVSSGNTVVTGGQAILEDDMLAGYPGFVADGTELCRMALQCLQQIVVQPWVAFASIRIPMRRRFLERLRAPGAVPDRQ